MAEGKYRLDLDKIPIINTDNQSEAFPAILRKSEHDLHWRGTDVSLPDFFWGEEASPHKLGSP